MSAEADELLRQARHDASPWTQPMLLAFEAVVEEIRALREDVRDLNRTEHEILEHVRSLNRHVTE